MGTELGEGLGVSATAKPIRCNSVGSAMVQKLAGPGPPRGNAKQLTAGGRRRSSQPSVSSLMPAGK